MKNKPRVLLLGGSGFIGRNILEQLSTKYQFISLPRSHLNLLNEAEVSKYFSKNRPSIVIYAVNIGGVRNNLEPKDMLANNLRMFFNIVSNKKYFDRMIFLGSGAEYDKRNSLSKVREKEFGKSVPIDTYGFYKYICSRFIEEVDYIVNLRLFGIFGKYEDYNVRFISNAICKTIFNLPITINQNVFFDYVFIDDFIRILDRFIRTPGKQKFYNVGSGKPIDLISISKKINMLIKNRKKIVIKKRGLAKEYSCNNKLIMNELKEFKFTPIDESLSLLYNYYVKNKHLINKKILLDN